MSKTIITNLPVRYGYVRTASLNSVTFIERFSWVDITIGSWEHCASETAKRSTLPNHNLGATNVSFAPCTIDVNCEKRGALPKI